MLKDCGVIICFVTKNDESNIEKFFSHSPILKKKMYIKFLQGGGQNQLAFRKLH